MRTTTDLTQFGTREIAEVEELFRAMRIQGLPDDFWNDGVHPMLNMYSGNVFLTNSNYEVAMMNGDKLESFYHCSNCGHEGFADECQLNEDGCNECCLIEEDSDDNGESDEL